MHYHIIRRTTGRKKEGKRHKTYYFAHRSMLSLTVTSLFRTFAWVMHCEIVLCRTTNYMFTHILSVQVSRSIEYRYNQGHACSC